jgi:DNA-binding NtrC family response regulator
MLLLDRFLNSGSSSLDLATGQAVRLRVLAAPTRLALFTARGAWRLVDAGPRSSRAFVEVWERWADAPLAAAVDTDPIRAALLDARDGCPRAVDIIAADAAQWRRATHDIAREARAAGFVPVAADVLGELLRAAAWQWPRWLADRSLVVLTCDGQLSASASLALLRLASRDARPHIVIRGATSALSRPTRLIRLPCAVHEDAGSSMPDEAGAHTPDALTARAWQRAHAGQVDNDTAACARWAVVLAPTLDGEAGARAALATTLTGQGRHLEARAALAPSLDSAADLSNATKARLDEARRRLDAAEQPTRHDRGMVDDFLRVLDACQAPEDEHTTLGRLLVLLRDRLAASAVACVCAEQGQLRVVSHLGAIGGEFRSVQLVLNSGRSASPASSAGPCEGAWAVRYAGAIVGALWVRWSGATLVMPADADALMGVAAAAIAPAVQACVERGRALAEAPDIPDLVGDSQAMRALRASLVRAAQSPFPVLIEGESGSGKELVARAIHRASPRRDRRFSALNCAALSEELAEAELFGHSKGAFTGAVADRPGLFEEANGGTLFLDEVSELSVRIQAKLLRVLQEYEVRRLGEAHVRRIDARIVAATNRPLSSEADAGRFRRDLRYRLDVVRLSIPPLRERLDDVPALVRHVWAGLCERTGSRAVLSPAAMAMLGRYDWPGNVRELQNVLASVMVTSPGRGTVSAAQIPAHVARTAALTSAPTLADARREFESRFVKAALARAHGRQVLAARELGVSRQGLAKVMARLGLVEPTTHPQAGV